MKIKYRSGYKYVLAETIVVKTAMAGFGDMAVDCLCLQHDGTLHILEGYAWDGPSGPAFDTPDFMPGSLVHDAFYQLLRAKCLPPEARKIADDELRRICLEDGMTQARAELVHTALLLFGGRAADPSIDPYAVREAP
jgi:hypothetical protein